MKQLFNHQTSLFYSILFVLFFSNTGISQSGISQISSKDSCENQPIFAILKTTDEIHTANRLSLNEFQDLKELAFLSSCLKEEFPVKSFRMVGIAANRDPIVIPMRSGLITSNEINAFAVLGNNFKVLFEDIKRGDNQLLYEGSFQIEVR